LDVKNFLALGLVMIAIFYQECEEIPVQYSYYIHEDFTVRYEINGNGKHVQARFFSASKKDTTIYNISSPWSYEFTANRSISVYLETRSSEANVDIFNIITVNDVLFKSDSCIYANHSEFDSLQYMSMTYTGGTIKGSDFTIIKSGTY